MTTGSDYRINDDDDDEIGSMNFERFFLSGKFCSPKLSSFPKQISSLFQSRIFAPMLNFCPTLV